MQRHTDRDYEHELEDLREKVLFMGAQVEELLSVAIEAFRSRDVLLAQSALKRDEEIDRLEITIDELSLRILARRQPVASDLRFITSALKLTTDIERIGDLAVSICSRVIELGDSGVAPSAAVIIRMAEVTHGMVRDAFDAFVAGDAVKAEQVAARDGAVDALYAQLFPELVAQMVANPSQVECATRIQSIGKCIERIADHATNISEMVVFMVRGQDVRHTGVGRGPQQPPKA